MNILAINNKTKNKNMATKKILTDIVSNGSITSDSANVGTATGGVAGSQLTSKSDSTSTGTNVNTWIDVNRVNTSTATGGTYGMINRVVSNTSSLDGGIVGANLVGRQSGSGGADYIYGEIVQADQLGGGDANMVIASSIRSNTKNNSTGTVNYNRGISVNAVHDSASGTVNYLQSAHLSVGLANGTAGEVVVALLDFDRSGGTITNDFAYLQIQEDAGSHTVGGTARGINSLTTLPSEFAGSIESTSFIKTGGTSSQFLKADGSSDSNTYLTSSSTQSKYLRSDQADSSSGTISAPKFYVGTASASSQWAFQARNSASTADSGLYFNSGSGNIFLRNSSNTLTTRINSSGDSYFTGGSLGIGTSGPGAKLHISDDTGLAFKIERTGAAPSTYSATNASDKITFDYTGGSGGMLWTIEGNTKMQLAENGDLGVQGTIYATPIVYAANQSDYALKMGASNNTAFDMGIKAKSTSSGSPYMSLCSANTDDVIVVQNSNVGINKVSPTYNLDVTGNGRFTSAVTATNFILSSDKRLKNNIEEVNNNHIDVNWKTFEMNSEEGQSRYGVIAQELEEVHPEFVRTDKEGMKSVAYIDLLIAKIAELEARLDKANI